MNNVMIKYFVHNCWKTVVQNCRSANVD